VASFLDGDVEVTLRLPPPLERSLRVEGSATEARVLDGDALVAEARSAPLELELPEPVDFEPAEARAAAQPDLPDHPFPECFVCGPGRERGDGLGLRPSPLGDGRVAAPWTPVADQAGRPALVWAALDCPGAFAVDPGFERGVSVLGRLHARVVAVPDEGEPCVVVGWSLGGEGRKQLAGTALYGHGGRLLGLGRATWILLPSSPHGGRPNE
jgi:hypothetical protein